MAAIKAQQ